jgi:hypothetical protein
MTRFAACLFFLSTTLCAQQDADSLRNEAPALFEQNDVGIIAALGISTGGGFGDLVNEEFRTQGYVADNGRMLFVDAELGMELRAAGHLFVLPRIGLIFTALNRRPPFTIPMNEYDPTRDPYEIAMDNVTIYSMLTCFVGARYYLRETRPFLLYVEAEVGTLAAASRVSSISFSAKSPCAVLLAGYSFSWGSRAIGLELGYRSIPVMHSIVSHQRSNGRITTNTQTDTHDFGGMFLNIVWQFDLFN